MSTAVLPRSAAPEPAAPKSGLSVPTQVAGVLAGSILAWVLTADWLAAAALWALWAGWRLLPCYQGPPVLALAYSFQWTQITLGVYYKGLTGRNLPANLIADTRVMVLLGLGCILALAVGIHLGARLGGRHRLNTANRPLWALPFHQALLAYAAATFLQGPLHAFAWRIPLLTQGILALSFLRLGLLFLIFRRLVLGRVRWQWIGGILLLEMLLGFTGFFAGFREPLIMLALAAIEKVSFSRLRHWAAMAVLAAVMLFTGLLWISIRTPYRTDYELEAFADSRSARLERITDLSTEWLASDASQMWYDLDRFVDRMWAVYYPALAVARVPEQLPHTDGQMTWEAVRHIITPRLFFPDKPILPSDSEKVRLYSGVWVAGADQGVSIAFGYAIESYVDFGVPWMFLPSFFWGLLMGALYRFLNHLIRHRELAIALVTVTFWIALYLFERSWIKTLGTSLTLMIYMGFTVFLLDRLLLEMRRARQRRIALPAQLARARAGRGLPEAAGTGAG